MVILGRKLQGWCADGSLIQTALSAGCKPIASHELLILLHSVAKFINRKLKIVIKVENKIKFTN